MRPSSRNALCSRRMRASSQIAEVHRELRETRDIVERVDGKLRLLAEGIVSSQEEIVRLREENRREAEALWSLMCRLADS